MRPASPFRFDIIDEVQYAAGMAKAAIRENASLRAITRGENARTGALHVDPWVVLGQHDRMAVDEIVYASGYCEDVVRARLNAMVEEGRVTWDRETDKRTGKWRKLYRRAGG